MIKIKLNDKKYQYPVYQIVNQFFDFEDIKFIDKDYDYFVCINEDKIFCGKNSEDFYEEGLNPIISIKEQVMQVVFKYFLSTTKLDMPWGTLIGIRPTKKVIFLMEQGKSPKEIIEYLNIHYLLSEDKAEICIKVAEMERNIVEKGKDKISIYIDMPFCPSRCLYCSFTSNSTKNNEALIEEYLTALTKEIRSLGSYVKEKKLNVQSIYFGGGTPTSVSSKDFDFVMKEIYHSFYSDSVEEFTVECGRPDSINKEKLLSMKQYGVSRISINPQTFNDETLECIGRKHSAKDIEDKFLLARSLGFDNINMDIILGLPGEDISSVRHTMDCIKRLSPENVTVHGLCVKRGSRLHEKMIFDYKLKKLSNKKIYDMYEATYDMAKELEMQPYYMYRQKNMIGNLENIGYSKASKEGIYNILMIEEKQTIIALGADAVTRVVFLKEGRHERFANVKDVKEYVFRIDEMIDKKIKLLNSLFE